MPEIQRIDYARHFQDSAPSVQAEDPGYAGLVANGAARLEPLQKIQVAFDQMLSRADAVARGGAWEYTGGSLGDHVRSTLEYVRRHLDVLRTATTAAEKIIDEFTQILSPHMEQTTMSGTDPNQGPQLTTTGEPHPLQEGGYDPNADPGLPSNISDVEAMKEGKTTRKEAEALGAADTKDNTAEAQPAEQNPVEAEAQAQADAGAGSAEAASTEGSLFTDEPKKGRNRR